MGQSAEVYSFREGVLLVWTGSANPYTAAYVQNVRGQRVYGWQNVGPSIGGTYTDHLTGLYATLSTEMGLTHDRTLEQIAASATAVHIQIHHVGVNGSAGVIFYSGRIDSLNMPGQEGGLMGFGLTYHANAWSAY